MYEFVGMLEPMMCEVDVTSQPQIPEEKEKKQNIRKLNCFNFFSLLHRLCFAFDGCAEEETL